VKKKRDFPSFLKGGKVEDGPNERPIGRAVKKGERKKKKKKQTSELCMIWVAPAKMEH